MNCSDRNKCFSAIGLIRVRWTAHQTVVLMLLCTIASCRSSERDSVPSSPSATSDRRGQLAPIPRSNGELFTDVTNALGLETRLAPWPDGKFLTPEITPGGVAVFDY